MSEESKTVNDKSGTDASAVVATDVAKDSAKAKSGESRSKANEGVNSAGAAKNQVVHCLLLCLPAFCTCFTVCKFYWWFTTPV